MKKNNNIISLLNIIFTFISLSSRIILENNYMFGLIKPTIIPYIAEILFILLILCINIYALIKNNLKEMKKILLINIIINSINGLGLIFTGIIGSVTSDKIYTFFNVVIFIVFVFSFVIISINKQKVNDKRNEKTIYFQLVLFLEIILSIILLIVFLDSINFNKINQQLHILDHEKYPYDNITSEKIKNFKIYEYNGRYGVKNEENQTIVSAEYEYISKFIFQDNLFYGYKNHTIDVYDDDGQKLKTYHDSVFFHYFKAFDSFSSKHSVLAK